MLPENLSFSALRSILRALGHRNFRLFFAGQTISLIGTWMQFAAMSWLVYRLTRSPFVLGLIGFSTQIPIFILTPFAGVLIDRGNRQRLLIITQVLAMLQALFLAALVFSGKISVWQLIFFSIFLGVVNAFDMPGRQSFIVDMLDNKEDLGNAIALNSFMFNLARICGPAIAGVVVATLGEPWCFLVNALSFLAVIWALIAMKITPRKRELKQANILKDLKEGFVYTFSFAPIKLVLLLLGLVSLIGMPYIILMPVFVKEVLRGDSQTFGMLMGASGLGALVGAFYLARRFDLRGLGKTIFFSTIIFALAVIAFSLSRIFWLSLFTIFLAGFGIMVQMAASNTLLQTIVDDNKRGRVMSFFTMSFIGMAPFGSLLTGYLAKHIGAPTTLLFSGTFCFLAALSFARGLRYLPEKILS